MKICFVIGSMKFSGAEKVLSIIAKELLENNNEVSVILLEQDYFIRGNEDGIITYGARANGNKVNRLMRRWSYIRKDVNVINPDIIISFGSVCNVNMLSSLFFKKIPKVVCERNDPNYDPRSKGDKFVRWLLYRFADGYVFQTEPIKDYFSKKIQNKAMIIPNPIIDSGIRWDIRNSKKSIATVARLDDFQKDYITMFKAFERFLEKHAEYTLDIYGDGPDRKKYEQYIENHNLDNKIMLHGKVLNPLNKIVESEVFLLTSRYEGMPNALMEALSIGIPCVSTDCGGGGAKALFEMIKSGKLASVGNVDEIVSHLEAVVEDDRLKREMHQKEITINDLLNRRVVANLWQNYINKIVKK